MRYRPSPCFVNLIATLALVAIVFCCFRPLSAQVLLQEDFNGTEVDSSLFTFSSAGDESFFGRTQLNSPDLPGAFDAPTVSDGTLKLRLQTFNPFGSAAGERFLADEIRTIQVFEPTEDAAIRFDVRARFVDDVTNPLSRGLVGGIFSFGLDAGFPDPFERDEVDIELLSNFPQDGVLLNVFDDQNFSSGGNFSGGVLPGLDITTFNDYRFELGTDAIRFFINDTLVREDFTGLAIEPQDFRLNINAPDSSFGFAFDDSLQPTADPNFNETFIFEIDSVVISQIAVPEPSTALAGLAMSALVVLRRRREG